MQRLKIILNHGSLAGLLAYAMFLIYYYVFGMNPLGGIKFLSIWIPIVFMYLGLKKHRDSELEGFATFGQLFMVSITFSFIFSSLSAMLIFLHCTIDGGVVAMHTADMLKDIGEAKDIMLKFISREDYQELVKEAESVDGAQLAMSDFFNKTVGSFIIALIISAVLKKQKPLFEERND